MKVLFICSTTLFSMKKTTIILFFLLSLFSCKKAELSKSDYFESATVEILIKDEFSVRAICIDNGKIWYAADNGKYGYYDLNTKTANQKVLVYKNIKPEFRSISSNGRSVFLLSVGSPALLYRIEKSSNEATIVYQENNKKAFYDSMQFWNDKEGIAMGDPTEDCLSVIITRDSGETWKKIPCDKMPKTVDGEAAFAASNTSLIINENYTWMVSGGKNARVFFSSDKGITWDVYKSPIVQGQEMTGIFSAHFYDENIGFLTGGNYEKPEQKTGNKALTINGGKTWTLVSENSGFGYASCVQFVPDSGGKQLVTLGYSGLNYSSDNGITWKQLLNDKDLHTIRFLDNSTAIAAGKNKIVKVVFSKS